jgi:hypothetical protein
MDEIELPIHLHYCKPRLQHVLVWSTDQDLFERGLEYIKLEFEGNLHPVTVADIPTIIEKIEEHEIEAEIEKYDFHLIKIYPKRVELLIKNNERHVIEEIDVLEDALEVLGQKLIKWYWMSSK